MSTSRDHRKVLDAVVLFVAIDVVHMGAGWELNPEIDLDYVAVFGHHFIADPNLSIWVRIDFIFALRSAFSCQRVFTRQAVGLEAGDAGTALGVIGGGFKDVASGASLPTECST